MTLTQAGNVGIGTASPGAKLDVSDGANGRFRFAGPLGTVAYADVDNFIFRSSNAVLTFGTFNGSRLDISTTAGYGLKLPATPGNLDAQTLDCYQDGGATAGGVAYTPTTTNFGGTISSITGRYVRVGGVVFARVDIIGTALTTTAFSSTVTAPAIAASGNFAVCIRASSGTQASAYHISGGSTVEFSASIASSSQITLTWFYFV
jgi:hypothetical protein